MKSWASVPPVLGLDHDHRIAGVVLAGEERVLLEALQLLLERLERALDLGGHVAVHGEELLRVVELTAEPLVSIESPLDAGVLG